MCVCVCVWCTHQARQCCDEGEYILANQEIDKFQSKEDAQKTRQDIEHFLETALPFINCDPKTLQYEFDVILSPELKVRSFFSSKHVFKNCKYSSIDNSFITSQLPLYQIAIT